MKFNRLGWAPSQPKLKLRTLQRLASTMLCLLTAVGILSLSVRQGRAFFAYAYTCNWQAGIVPVPTNPQRVGYVTDFQGLGLTAPLAKDLTVSTLFNKTPSYTPLTPSAGIVKVVAVIESVSWAGGVGDAISVSCFMSQENDHVDPVARLLDRQLRRCRKNVVRTILSESSDAALNPVACP